MADGLNSPNIGFTIGLGAALGQMNANNEWNSVVSGYIARGMSLQQAQEAARRDFEPRWAAAKATRNANRARDWKVIGIAVLALAVIFALGAVATHLKDSAYDRWSTCATQHQVFDSNGATDYDASATAVQEACGNQP